MSHAIRMTEEEWQAASARLTTLRRVQAGPAKRKPAKYGNHRVQIDGHTFDSKREAKRYAQLRDLLRAGLISDLELQVKFILAPAVRIKGRNRPPIRYIADFAYRQGDRFVVEDAKGHATDAYRLKRHLMKSVLGIDIEEV